ncbi:TlpA family protein disulfide reductase [Reichenbachiella agarivorans]|uniref:TlpA family protein disulfide reductase n=1 Tax=Reichenbachiella agarivorans TaxID=2979464 RepID=A0ABY6CS97_9BACT|nr:TlpA disulfide reductase family protein [Reichenbachiella agarivorans]UXP33401.1 TlpA family protein disulfide reductase [Reichenbachiella agarivorans]
MKKTLIAVALFFSVQAYAQDKPAPEYLKGSVFPDSVRALSLTALDGSEVFFGEILAAHTGQKVVLDIWATWCKDCIVSLPELQQLMKDGKKNDIHFVLLSVDREEIKWREGIKKYKIKGEHFFINEGWDNALSNYIDLDWVPRYLIIDEDGKITVPKVVKVDDPTLKDNF